MNIFIIHSGKDIELVKQIRDEIKRSCRRTNISYINHSIVWKHDVKKLMKEAHMILFMVGENSHNSRNIDWELRKALKLKKSIIYYKLSEKNELNHILMTKDPFTKEDIILADGIKNIKEMISIVKIYENNEYIHLIEPGASTKEILEQYKLFSETSESLVTRRQNVNNFFITANTAIITIAATVFSLDGILLAKLIVMMALTIPGILLNHSWITNLEAYGILNSSKMKILGMLEKKLSVSLYDAE